MEETSGNLNLASDDIPIGTPLAWPVLDQDGTLLLDQGTTLDNEAEREFLLQHFQPRRGDLADSPPAPAQAPETRPTGEPRQPSWDSMRLPIGAPLGIHPHLGMGRTMYTSRLIGFAPNHALFATAPLSGGQPLQLGRGEQVEMIAMAAHAVFRFVCTVDAISKTPFNYIVLSEPGSIRLLRERKSMRVPVRLALRYGADQNSTQYDGMGVVRDISVLGLSLGAAQTLGQVGERLRVALRIRDKDIDVGIQAVAIIRNVQNGAEADGNLHIHGLEFEHLEAAQQIALKAFVFDRQDLSTTQWFKLA